MKSENYSGNHKILDISENSSELDIVKQQICSTTAWKSKIKWVWVQCTISVFFYVQLTISYHILCLFYSFMVFTVDLLWYLDIVLTKFFRFSFNNTNRSILLWCCPNQALLNLNINQSIYHLILSKSSSVQCSNLIQIYQSLDQSYNWIFEISPWQYSLDQLYKWHFFSGFIFHKGQFN